MEESRLTQLKRKSKKLSFGGAKNKDSFEALRQPWEFGNSGTYTEFGRITTKFNTLAFLGYQYANMVKTPKRGDIEAVLSNKVFRIIVVTYFAGGRLDKDYHMVLKQGEKIIRPTSVGIYPWPDITGPFPKSLLYRIMVTAGFPYSKVDLKGKGTIILRKYRGESRFEVDFSHYK